MWPKYIVWKVLKIIKKETSGDGYPTSFIVRDVPQYENCMKRQDFRWDCAVHSKMLRPKQVRGEVYFSFHAFLKDGSKEAAYCLYMWKMLFKLTSRWTVLTVTFSLWQIIRKIISLTPTIVSILQRYLTTHVYCSTIYNSQDMNQHRWMGKE